MIGIDSVEIERFANIGRNDFLSWNKVFTRKEWQYCFNKPLPAQHLASNFAAKEAVMKAVGEPVMKRYTLIEIGHEPNGRPTAHIAATDVPAVAISMSHDHTRAVAVALVV